MRFHRHPYCKFFIIATALALAGCGTAPLDNQPSPRPVQTSGPVIKSPSGHKADPSLPVLPPANSGRGAYYQDDGPGDSPPPNLADMPDADVRNDPLLPRSNRPYVVFGKNYTPITDDKPFTQIGIGSWYGKKFHGQRTSSGELYDMYKMTAAHPTLPIPSYARVSNLLSGATVIVRINDRGPFHDNRVIDVSYTAALKLGLLSKGSHELKIERILPDEVDRILATREGVSGVTKARLTPQLKDRLAQASNVPAAASNQPLVLTPSAPGRPPQEIAALMLADRAPAGYAAPVSALAGGFYLQLGAYSRAENAEAVRARLSGKIDSMEVVQGGSVFRLFGGPFATRQEAQLAAQGLPSSMGLKPIVVQR